MKEVGDGQGLGLWSMRERVRLVEGRFDILSERLKGTRVEVSVPLKEKSDASGGDAAVEPIRASAVASGRSAG